MTTSPQPRFLHVGFSVERTWIFAVVGYSVLRFVLAWGTMGDTGVNPWVFGVIDVGTAWPYAKSTAGLVRSGWDREWLVLAGWLVVALTTFMAPYAYLWWAGEDAGSDLRLGLAVIVVVLFVAAGLGVTRKIVRGPTQ